MEPIIPHLKSIKVPCGANNVHKDECVFSHDTPVCSEQITILFRILQNGTQLWFVCIFFIRRKHHPACMWVWRRFWALPKIMSPDIIKSLETLYFCTISVRKSNCPALAKHKTSRRRKSPGWLLAPKAALIRTKTKRNSNTKTITMWSFFPIACEFRIQTKICHWL